MTETTVYIEIEAAASGSYQPAEKQVLWPADAAHPGCDEMMEDITVMLRTTDGKNILDITRFLSEDQIQEIEQQLLEAANDDADARHDDYMEAQWEERRLFGEVS